MARVSTADFWDGLYATGGDGWELGQPATPLVDFVEQTPPPPGRVAVLGCGRGHDARFLATRGYEVVGYDFSSAALTAARALARREGVAVVFEQRDIFTLGREAAHAFDGVRTGHGAHVQVELLLRRQHVMRPARGCAAQHQFEQAVRVPQGEVLGDHAAH